MGTLADLTKRELEVAELLAWGQSKKEVAARLFISYYTVDNHCKAIYQKAGVSKASELAAWWFCNRFHISFSMSPLKRGVLAIFLLCCLLPREFFSSKDTMRASRTRTSRTSRARRGRRSEDYQLEF